jgi:hypothetical protein
MSGDIPILQMQQSFALTRCVRTRAKRFQVLPTPWAYRLRDPARSVAAAPVSVGSKT